jgi:GNAT superfamily N-acetyltransferase
LHPPYIVRRAEISEAGLIGDLRLAALLSLEMPGEQLDAVQALRAALPDVDADLVRAGRYFVADCAGELIGGIGWSVLPLSFRGAGLATEDGLDASLSLDPGTVLVRGFFVDPDIGRGGVGANLLAELEADAAREGFDASELVAPSSAQFIYRSLGFRTVRRLKLRLHDGPLPLLHMRKALPLRLKSAA